MKDDPINICPKCEGGVKRLFYPVGVVFKGSGWYVNDSRKPEPTGNGGEKSTNDNAKTEEAKPTTTAESKPETKAEAKPETKSEASPATKTKD